jgi:aryl-alcohol dehydrogenase-like predicted oxidoreductase
MQYKTLGNTGLLVSTLCLGTMTFNGGEGFWRTNGTVDQAGADEPAVMGAFHRLCA